MMIEINDFTYSYTKRSATIFKNFNLKFQEGHIYGLLGKNGEGKSTLLYNIMGALRPRAGSITFKGLVTQNRYAEVLADCYMLAEEFYVPPYTLKKYIKFYAPFYPNFSYDDLQRYLKDFDLDIDDKKLSELSMGQQKKVMISFALACNTSLLILDEPTNGLDIPSKSQFRKIVGSGMRDDRTIIISTHQVRDIENLLDYVVIIQDSKVLLNEPMSNIETKLLFAENAPDSIYSQNWAGGVNTVSQNHTGEVSAINLELLFNAAVASPEELNKIFND
ncbi:MAG: ABC transporter ATP-binding protein [bacterium]